MDRPMNFCMVGQLNKRNSDDQTSIWAHERWRSYELQNGHSLYTSMQNHIQIFILLLVIPCCFSNGDGSYSHLVPFQHHYSMGMHMPIK